MLGSGSITRKRYGAGSWGTDGRYIAGSSSTSTVTAAAQTNGFQVSRGEGGGLGSEEGRLYMSLGTAQAPIPGDTGTLGDEFSVDGGWWRVVGVDKQQPSGMGLRHERVRVQRVVEGAELGVQEGYAVDAETALQALRGAVAECLGSSIGKVIVADQRAPRPSYPYASVRLVQVSTVGAREGVDCIASRIVVTAGEGEPVELSWVDQDGNTAVVEVVGLSTLAATATALSDAIGSDLGASCEVEGAEVLAVPVLPRWKITAAVGATWTEEAGEGKSQLREISVELATWGENAGGLMERLALALEGWSDGAAVSFRCEGPVEVGYLERGLEHVGRAGMRVVGIVRTSAQPKATLTTAPELAEYGGGVTVDSPSGDLVIPFVAEV